MPLRTQAHTHWCHTYTHTREPTRSWRPEARARREEARQPRRRRQRRAGRAARRSLQPLRLLSLCGGGRGSSTAGLESVPMRSTAGLPQRYCGARAPPGSAAAAARGPSGAAASALAPAALPSAAPHAHAGPSRLGSCHGEMTRGDAAAMAARLAWPRRRVGFGRWRRRKARARAKIDYSATGPRWAAPDGTSAA